VYALLPQRPQTLHALPVARARSWLARCLTAAPTTVHRHARVGSRGSRCCGLLPTTSLPHDGVAIEHCQDDVREAV
jgi:hypothetical protein